MRKILVVTVLIISILSCFVTSFAEQTINEGEIRGLIEDFIDLRLNMGFYFQGYDKSQDSINVDVDSGTGVTWAWSFYPVKEGYKKEDIINLCNNTLSDSYSKLILNSSEKFFKYYYYDNEGNCYYKVMNDHIGANGSLMGFVYFDIEDIDSLEIIEESSDKYYVNTFAYLALDSDRKVKVSFTIVREKGNLKIDYFDCNDMIFSFEKDRNKDVSLTKELFVDIYKAAVCELYYYTTHAPDDILETSGMGRKEIKTENGRWTELEGSLAIYDEWIKYAREFCSEEISKALISLNFNLKTIDGKMCRGGSIPYAVFYGERYLPEEFDYTQINTDDITIIPQGEKMAYVKVSFMSGNRDLTFTLGKEDNRWVITGGDFIDQLDDYFGYDRYQNVPTGDSSPVLFVVATLLLLLTITKRKQLLKNGQNIKTEFFK